MTVKKIVALMTLLTLCSPISLAGNNKRAATTPAKKLFGVQKSAAAMSPQAFGSYAKGCLAGSQQLAADGSGWQAMRLSRNRNWGHPDLVDYIARLAQDVENLDGWPGLLVGDMAQPRGGPMLTGHKSHQIGLDVDIWLMPANGHKYSLKERENVSAISVRKDNFTLNQKTWSPAHARLIKRAVSYPEVARVFVHPTIKQELCQWAGDDRGWLRKVRAWYGHHYHFHVRLKCPEGSTNCKNQAPPPSGDGCGKELDWWLSADAYKPGPEKPKKPQLTLADLPTACGAVLRAP